MLPVLHLCTHLHSLTAWLQGVLTTRRGVGLFHWGVYMTKTTAFMVSLVEFIAEYSLCTRQAHITSRQCKSLT